MSSILSKTDNFGAVKKVKPKVRVSHVNGLLGLF